MAATDLLSPIPTRDLPTRPLSIDGFHLSIADVVSVAHGRKVRLLDPCTDEDAPTITRITASRAWVQRTVELTVGQQVVYGINTGFGPLADVLIAPQQAGKLSTNLIVSHAVGLGEPLPRTVVRAAMLIRANTLARGNSGVRLEVINTLLAMLNAGVHPVVPGWGSVGASGDLAPLSHLALPLLQHEDGDEDALTGLAVYEPNWVVSDMSPPPVSGGAAMAAAGIPRLRLEAKEGLALNNGTTVSAALLALALYEAELTLAQSVSVLAMSMEAVRGYFDALDSRIHAARNHPGQVQVAARLRQLTKDSMLLRSSQSYGSLPHDLPQDAYSFRCAPQVLGAVADTFAHVREVTQRELNAACDNPLIFADDDAPAALSGGNFHGQPLAFAADFLSIAAAEIASISERRMARLLDPRYSRGLPAMLTQGSGLRSGYMMLQYAAAALVSANKTLAHPDSVDSIPTGANQEDHVSMSTNAAHHAGQIISNVVSVVASELVCAAQGLDFRLAEGQPAPAIAEIHHRIRQRIPHLEAERPPSRDVAIATQMLRNGELL